jgi:hypothetical protein
MIDKTSLSAEWLNSKQAEYKKDPSLIESMIHALYLLEQLKQTELDFIFKGGTSLILLLERPARFSVDIDIIINPKINREVLEHYLIKIVGDIFIKMSLDERRSFKGKIPKAHYKFIYKSNLVGKNQAGQVVQNPDREILLDVLFAENPYPVLKEKSINTEWLKQIGEPLSVNIPCENSIAGDKLTAYAPTTIGVPYKVDKEKEIIKQLFDISTLFDVLSNVDIFRKSFYATAKGEISYKSERELTSEIVLQDIIDTGIIIAKRDNQKDDDAEKFEELRKGINQFGHFVYYGNFRIEEAQVAAAKAAYLASHTLVNAEGELKKFNGNSNIQTSLIEHPEFNFLNKKLKFVAKGEALFYWSETIKLIR